MATKKKKAQPKKIKKLIADAAKAVETIPEDELEAHAAKSKTDIPKEGLCFHCKKPQKSPDYCYGCKAFVCDNCDKNFNMPMGKHEADVHLEEQDDLYD